MGTFYFHANLPSQDEEGETEHVDDRWNKTVRPKTPDKLTGKEIQNST